MFWQIYQKLMFSGFLSSGKLCLTNHLRLFWSQPLQSPTEGAKIQHEFSWFYQKKKIQNITAKLIDISAKNLDDSEVLSCDFPGHKNLSILIDLSGLCNLTGLNSL